MKEPTVDLPLPRVEWKSDLRQRFGDVRSCACVRVHFVSSFTPELGSQDLGKQWSGYLLLWWERERGNDEKEKGETMRRRKGRKTYLNSQGPVLRSYKTASYKSVTITFVNVHSLICLCLNFHKCDQFTLATFCNLQLATFSSMHSLICNAQSCNLLSCNFVKRALCWTVVFVWKSS